MLFLAFNKIVESGYLQAVPLVRTDAKQQRRNKILNDESHSEQDGKSMDDEEMGSDNSFSSTNDKCVERKVCEEMHHLLYSLLSMCSEIKSKVE